MGGGWAAAAEGGRGVRCSPPRGLALGATLVRTWLPATALPPPQRPKACCMMLHAQPLWIPLLQLGRRHLLQAGTHASLCHACMHAHMARASVRAWLRGGRVRPLVHWPASPSSPTAHTLHPPAGQVVRLCHAASGAGGERHPRAQRPVLLPQRPDPTRKLCAHPARGGAVAELRAPPQAHATPPGARAPTATPGPRGQQHPSRRPAPLCSLPCALSAPCLPPFLAPLPHILPPPPPLQVFVGDLSPSIDDTQLYNTFARYHSCV